MLDDVRVVFLDIDNTLYDYEESVREHVEVLRGEFGLDRFTPQEFVDLYWKGNDRVPEAEKMDLLRRDVAAYRRRVWEEVLACAGGDCPPAAEISRRFAELRDTRLPPHPGMLDFVGAVRRSRRVGIISNGPGHLQRRKLAALKVEPLVEPGLVFISHEVGWDKPDERIFRRALAAAAVDPHACLMVGDDPVNDHGAKAVGMRFALFQGKPADPPACATPPDHVVRTWRELATLFGH